MELQSQTITKITPAFIKAQSIIEAVTKDSENPFFKSSYADISSVIKAIKKALNDNEIGFLQPTMILEGKTVVVTTLIHTSGEWLRGIYPITTTKESSQEYGSALTYARRYALVSLLGLEQEDDDGNASSTTPPPPKKPSQPIDQNECAHEKFAERIVQTDGPNKGKKYEACADCRKFIKWI